MPATFKAVETFHLKSRHLFVIYGDIVKGTVRPGMRVSLPLNGTVTIHGPIEAVEYVDVTPGERSHVALCVGFEESAEELTFWEAMNIADETLQVLDADDP